MEKVFIDLKEESYYIHIGKNILNDITNIIGDTNKIMVITDENVNSYYGDLILEALKGRDVHKFIIKAGEDSKSFSSLEEILDNMIQVGLNRKSTLIALGGGVVGDIVGFAASIYMRGIPYIQIPTSLLSQVDSSVGGKTAINMPQGKNLVGSFYQPKAVIIDIKTLKSLDEKDVIGGLGEVIKYGIIWDYEFLHYIDKNLDKILNLEEDVLRYVIKKCCQIKGEIVSQDEKEEGIRKILNLGHTLAHGLESVTNYNRYSHGQAVLIGIYYEMLMAKRLNLIDDKYFEEIAGIINKLDINLDISSLPMDYLVESMAKDKKNREDKISFIFPRGKESVEEVFLDKGDIYW